jgi:hypothetical protein
MKWIAANIFAVGLLVAGAATETHAQTWAVYKPDGVGYSIEMPGEWKTSVLDILSQMGPVKAYFAEVQSDSEEYATMYMIYPVDKLAGDAVTFILDGVRDAAVSNVHGTLRSEERVMVSNLPGRQIIVDGPENSVVVFRFFLKDNVLVQGIVAGQAGVESQPNAKRFLESMQTVGTQYGLNVSQP